MSSQAGFEVSFRLEASKFYKDLEDLDHRTRPKVQKAILRDVANRVFKSKLRAHAATFNRYSKTGNLKRSMGNITGKSKRVSTIFHGPRMATMGVRDPMNYKGWVTNILENVKPGSHIKRRSHFRWIHERNRQRAEMEVYRSIARVLRRKGIVSVRGWV